MINKGTVEFPYSNVVLVGSDNQVVSLEGNNLDLLKTMGNSLKFNIEK